FAPGGVDMKAQLNPGGGDITQGTTPAQASPADAKSALRSGWKGLGTAGDVAGTGGGFGGFGDGAKMMLKGKGGAEAELGTKEQPPELDPSELAARTEFVILFVWQEPISGETTAETTEKKN